jgi:hypothetical protein
MQIVINHLTRMQQGCMCTAGIDLETGLHIRPVLDRQMPIDLLSVHGGPFDIGRIIDLGQTRFVGKVPEVEDQLFEATATRHVGDMPPDAFWQLLERSAQEKLGAIFGPALERIGSTCAINETFGLRSLGCYWAASARLFLEDRSSGRKIRFTFQSGEYAFNLPVTDIRLYTTDHVTPSEAMVERVSARIAALPRVLVSVGLCRAFRKSAEEPSRHWLQVNNIHLPEEPCWKLNGTHEHPGQSAS